MPSPVTASHVTLQKKINSYVQDDAMPDHSHNGQPTPAGTVQKKKPLPKIPKNTVSSSDKRNSTLILSDSGNKGYVITGPSWTTTQNNEDLTESPQPINDKLSSVVAGQEQFDTSNMLLTQSHGSVDYYNGIDYRRSFYMNQPQQQIYYPYPQQAYWSPQQYPNAGGHFQNQYNSMVSALPSSAGGMMPELVTDKSIVIGTNSEWKTSTKSNLDTVKQNIGRSDSLKIETAIVSGPVPFSKSGYLPLKTHLEKPYEPPTEEIKTGTFNKESAMSLQRKISKEEIFEPTSVLLQKLNLYQQQQQQVEGIDTTNNSIATTFLAPMLCDHNSSSGTESGSLSTPRSISSFSYHPTSAHPLQTSTSASNLSMYKQKHSNSMPLLTGQTKLEEETKEDLEDPSVSFSAAERFFQQPSSASPVSRIPSPWGTSTSKRSLGGRQDISRISTGSIPNLTVYTAQVPDQISTESCVEIKGQPKGSSSKAEQYFHEHKKPTLYGETSQEANDHQDSTPSEAAGSKYSLSIASCSLINIRSNTKLYRRMAIKTHNKEIQLTYAKYLLQISKLYDKNANKSISTNTTTQASSAGVNAKHTQETPAQTRHRLLSEAGYWIERLSKAGKPEALFIKGRWYLLGPQAEDCVLRGYEKVQEAKAFKCFLRASKAGWTEAHYELANLWKKRGHYGKAIQCYEKGAKENHTPSIYKMAKILLRGQLKKKKDISKGMVYLKQAADMDDSASAEPAFVLGCIYANEFERIGIQGYNDSVVKVEEKVNYSLALKYLKKSAHYGYPDAIYFMGQVSESGMLGQLCDSWQAYQQYMKAAEVNHAGAMLDLSRIYSQGISGLLAAQKQVAFKWCKRAADQGFDQAEYVLGKYYEDGIGVTPDFPRALEYFGKAASKGYQPAAEKLNRPMADGTRRKRTLKKGEKEAEFKFIPIVISVPKVKQDDDDDDDNDGAIDDHQGICKYTQGSKAAAKTGSGSGGSNICKIQ